MSVDYVMRYAVVPVADLPESDYTWEKVSKGCMTPKASALAWRLWRRITPRRLTFCCWYHRRDWRGINRLAVQLLDAARRSDPEDELAIAAWVWSHPEVRSLPERDAWALRTLFFDPIDPPEPGSDIYGNGRHRSRAMRDACVPQTVVQVYDALI